MRKIAFVLALVLVLAVPAAAAGNYVPSIQSKPAPEWVPKETDEFTVTTVSVLDDDISETATQLVEDIIEDAQKVLSDAMEVTGLDGEEDGILAGTKYTVADLTADVVFDIYIEPEDVEEVSVTLKCNREYSEHDFVLVGIIHDGEYSLQIAEINEDGTLEVKLPGGMSTVMIYSYSALDTGEIREVSPETGVTDTPVASVVAVLGILALGTTAFVVTKKRLA